MVIKPSIDRDQLFEAACAHATVGMCLLDPEGRFLRVNRAFCDFLGLSESEVLQRDFSAVTHPDDRQRSLDLLRSLHSGEIDSCTTEKRYVHRSGKPIWAQLTVSAVRDPASGSPRLFIAQILDLDAQKRMERLLRRSEEGFRTLAETSSDLISRHRVDGTCVYASPACRRLLGYEPEELVGRSIFDFVHPEDLPAVRATHLSTLRDPSVYVLAYRIRRKDGAYLWFESSGRLVAPGEDAREPEVQTSSRDITERKRSEERVRELARHLEEANRRLQEANLALREIAATDPLTGMSNRREFEARLVVELRRAARSGSAVSLLFLDLDHFKRVNDRFGHPTGDELLVKLANLLVKTIRTSDVVARYGGEEFVVLLPDTEEEGAMVLAETLRQAVAERLAARLPLTVSVGAATHYPGPSGEADPVRVAERLVAAADEALYRAKREGRNRCRAVALGYPALLSQAPDVEAQAPSESLPEDAGQPPRD